MLLHPVLLFFIAVVLLSLASKFFGGGSKEEELNLEDDETILVVVVVPKEEECERTVHNILSKCIRRHRLRIHIVKAVSRNEFLPELRKEDRMFANLHLAKADGFDPSVARASTLRKEYDDEEYVCTIPYDSVLEHGWDDALIRAHLKCERKDPLSVLTCRPMDSSSAPTFIRALRSTSSRETQLFRTEGVAFHEPVLSRPQPSLFVYPSFLFGRGSLVRNLPPPSCVSSCNEEMSYSMCLWTTGYNFFAPHIPILSLSSSTAFSGAKDSDSRPASSDPTPGTSRSVLEWSSFVGLKKGYSVKEGTGKPTKRSCLGLSPKANVLESIAKYGTASVM